MEQNEKRITQAAAISYDPAENDVPILSAFGEGHLAQKIVEVAKESGVPVVPEPGLTNLLSKLSAGDEIAPEMYDAVAKVLAFVSEVDRAYGDKVKRGLE
ncbi:MAG: EscU/YscU/HrcU family type III secretion system export apparatus switch protein [Oscillospiraceae bacterium]|jgi:flagellar biosynthesis protein|nr:EscU/YscU/HrcU family type III secretion system export apparatus switch protein [Oscillospiraceae bacterium]